MSERIHFGSLEHQEKARIEAARKKSGGNATGQSAGELALAKAKEVGNINIGKNNNVTLELSDRSKDAQEKHAKLLQRVESERRARQIIVPTGIHDVKMKLRSIGHPITLFGELPADRRERLRILLAKIEVQGEDAVAQDGFLGTATTLGSGIGSAGTTSSAPKKAEKAELFYTEASEVLLSAREKIAAFSWPRSHERLSGQKRRRDSEELQNQKDTTCTKIVETVSKLGMNASQIADDRPTQCCRFSPDDKTIATCSWSGVTKLWDAKTCEMKCLYRGHQERVTTLAWHPNAYGSMSESGSNLATGSADGSCKLWALDNQKTPVAALVGHKDRISTVAFHPMGQHVATSSYDKTWRMWDIEKGGEIQMQEGHAAEVYCLAFQRDGALVATGDLGAVGRVWDLRSGKSIFLMQGHGRQMLGMDWSPNGHHLVTGSDDRTARIWDLRKMKALYTIPAHSALISSVRFSPTSGELLVTASHDATVKIWSARDWSLLKTVEGHEGKVMCVDVAKSEDRFITCSFDRTFKVWAHEDAFCTW